MLEIKTCCRWARSVAGRAHERRHVPPEHRGGMNLVPGEIASNTQKIQLSTSLQSWSMLTTFLRRLPRGRAVYRMPVARRRVTSVISLLSTEPFFRGGEAVTVPVESGNISFCTIAPIMDGDARGWRHVEAAKKPATGEHVTITCAPKLADGCNTRVVSYHIVQGVMHLFWMCVHSRGGCSRNGLDVAAHRLPPLSRDRYPSDRCARRHRRISCHTLWTIESAHPWMGPRECSRRPDVAHKTDPTSPDPFFQVWLFPAVSFAIRLALLKTSTRVQGVV